MTSDLATLIAELRRLYAALGSSIAGEGGAITLACQGVMAEFFAKTGNHLPIILDALEAALKRVTELEVAENELNELHDYLDQLKLPGVEDEQGAQLWQRRAHASERVASLTEQRDRLREAATEVMEHFMRFVPNCSRDPNSIIGRLDAALALCPKPEATKEGAQ